jgi:hypothetical protein
MEQVDGSLRHIHDLLHAITKPIVGFKVGYAFWKFRLYCLLNAAVQERSVIGRIEIPLN